MLRKLLIKLNLYWLGLAILTLPACDFFDSGTSNQGFKELPDLTVNRIPLSAVSLNTVNSCDDLKSKMTQSLVSRYTSRPYNYCVYPAPVAGGVAGGGGASAPATDASNPGSTSGTNNQEAGVNEGDSIKVNGVDGDIYVAHGQYLLVVDAFPADTMKVLHSVDLHANIIALYFDPELHNILALTRYDTPYYILAGDAATGGGIAPIPYPIKNETSVHIFHYLKDQTNPPQLLETIKVDGYYQDSRRIAGRLHLISRHYSSVVEQMLNQSTDFNSAFTDYRTAVQTYFCSNPDIPTDNYQEALAIADSIPQIVDAKAKLAQNIGTVVNSQDIASLLPQASRIAPDDTSTPIDNYLRCEDVYFPDVDSQWGQQIITSMNTDGSDVEASALVNNSWQTYVSQNNLYLAENNNYWYWWAPTRQQTSIHKVALSANDRPKYVATGVVDGNAMNSFQFSEQVSPEYGSVLRVTTTENNWGSPLPLLDPVPETDASGAPIIQPPTSLNHLTTLKDNGSGKLARIGEIRNIAPNEQIRSTRFDGNRAFMVTFRQVDPLFTIDLSDPFAPSIAGEMKLPGFASYIHIYDQNHILTIGPAGTDTRLTGQIQLRLIDISDLQTPTVVDSVIPDFPGYSSSVAQYDPHAFTFFDGNLLAIPIRYNYYDPTGSIYQNFAGVVAYRITPESGFEKLGQVDHADLAQEYYCQLNSVDTNLYPGYCDQGYYVSWAMPRRSVFEKAVNGDVFLYTISDVGIKAGQLDLTKKGIVDISREIFPPHRYILPIYYLHLAGGAVSSPAAGGGAAAAQ